MADFRSVKCEMWAQDEWFMDLPIDGKLLWMYLFTNAHTSVAGIYKLPLKTIAFETGIDTERVQDLMQVFAQRGKAKYADGVIWVVKMREHQATKSPLVEKRINKDLAVLPDTPLKREYLAKYGMDTVSIGYLESCSDTDTDTDTDTETDGDSTYPPGFAAIETNFRLNLLNAVKERDPRQQMAGGFSLSDSSKAALLQVMTSGPVLSAKAIDWALDQWEAAKPQERFRVDDKSCVNWLLAVIANSYQAQSRTNGKTTDPDNRPRVPAPPAAEVAAADARQAAYEKQIAVELARAGRQV